MRAPGRGDVLPWYRQFWPWFLILLPASVVVAGLTTVYIANRHADDLVVDDYYKEGLAINRRLEKKALASELQISARLQFDTGSVVAHVQGPVDAPELDLFLSHPLQADQDFTVRLARISAGQYRGELTRKITPRWHWVLESGQQDTWRLDGEVQASEIGRAPGR